MIRYFTYMISFYINILTKSKKNMKDTPIYQTMKNITECKIVITDTYKEYNK